MNSLTDEQKLLSDWLSHWCAEEALSTDNSTHPSSQLLKSQPASRYQAVPPDCTADQLTVGAVILLPPTSISTRLLPRYVALLTAEQDYWQVAPFSRFPLPATPDELATNQNAPALRVLCLWNSHTLHASHLLHGWQAGQLSAEELDLIALWRAMQPPTIPAPLRGRLGPRLIHPLDPRHRYLDEERQLWPETAATLSLQEDTTELPLAAEESEQYEP